MKDFLEGVLSLVVIGLGLWIGLFWHPDHARRTGFLRYHADPGYSFVPDKWIPSVQWNPGTNFPEREHVLATDQQDQWRPVAGYRWSGSAEAESRETAAVVGVNWAPGSAHPDRQNVVAFTREGYWQPVKGYSWSNREQLVAAWTPGMSDPDRSHYVSGAAEGSWDLEAGYQLVDTLFGKSVQWTAGLGYPGNGCLVSSATEGGWQPIANHRVSRDEDGRIRILADSTNPDWGSALGKLAVALVVHSVSQSSSDDSTPVAAAKTVGEHVAGEVAVSGLKDIFNPTADDPCADVLLAENWR